MKKPIVLLMVCLILGPGFSLAAVAGAPRNHCTWVTEDDHGHPHKICKWDGTADPMTCGQMTQNERAAHGCPATTAGGSQHRVCQKVWSDQFKEYTEKCHMETGGGPNVSIPAATQPVQVGPMTQGQAVPPQPPQPIDYQSSAQSATNLVNSIKGLLHK